MSCAWKEPNCRIGLILGTGSNACYLEEISAIGTVDAADFPGQRHMVVNTEWGGFGSGGELDFVRTKVCHTYYKGMPKAGSISLLSSALTA